ncbi:Uncharacterised protein [uncultured Clostridium sp.]|uniref:cohesin domain-containing protein n=1 Tax=uncultured Clostridium sp. TaxID=59620 RepID=UPI000821E8F3|nr:cohesin domain-containing protein [uncultured Clostridium sp.]SCJ35111.1 Uncharacterised protein [uncultured Clostridium sp.]
MKKLMTFLVAFFLFTVPINAYAADTTVEVKVEGEVKKGKNINIILNVNDVENFYAGSVDFIYNADQLKVNSVNSSDFITGTDDEIVEIGGETAKNGNTANYGFTFVGDKPGLSGSGTFVTISATVLSDDEFSINKGNMQVKLVKKTDGTVTNYGYKFIGVGNQDVGNEAESNNNANNNNNQNNDSQTNADIVTDLDENTEEITAEVEEENNKKSLSEMIANAFKDFNPFSSETSMPKRVIAYLVIICTAVGLVFLGNFIYKKIEENK